MNATATPCTTKQAETLAGIVAKRACTPAIIEASLKAANGNLTMKEASDAISNGFRMPWKPSSAAPVEKGYYLMGETVYVVVDGKSSGNRYAKRLSVASGKGRWEYAAGAVHKLTPAMKLTVQQAAALGKHHGCCVVCGATLTDEKSVAAGIGPVCAKKL